MKLNNKKVTKLEGDASERKFYRSKNSIIIFSKKNKKKNLLIYDAINRILNSGGICAPRLLKNNYKKNLIEVNDLGDVTLLRLLKNKKECLNIGLFEDDDVISIIEWPEKVYFKPKKRIEIYFKYFDNYNSRLLKIKFFGKNEA